MLLKMGRQGGLPPVVDEMVDVARAHARLLPADIMAEGILVSALTQAAATISDIRRPGESRAYAAEGLDRLTSFRAVVSPSRFRELDEDDAFLLELLSRAP
jgi:hypothetical protein